MVTEPISAEAGRPCDCCKRIHRKLYLTYDGYWLGETCANDYRVYLGVPSVTSAQWVGWESRHAKIERMIGKAK